MKNAKKAYKQVGKGILVFAASSIIAQIILILINYAVTGSKDVTYNNLYDWLLTFIPIYMVGFPLGYYVLQHLPVSKAKPKKFGIKKLIVLFLECEFIMYIGNIIGTGLSFVFSFGKATNPVLDLMTGDVLLRMIVVSIVAPIIEELFFRKILMDRVLKFGEKTAIIFSAFTFAMFHMNLYQMFYAFGVGLIFAYIYAKTRNVKYTIGFHIIINFFGGVIAPLIVSNVNIEALNNLHLLSEQELVKTLISVSILLIYAFIKLVLVIIGAILLAKNSKTITFKKALITKENEIKIPYFNIYYGLFFGICVIFTIMSLFSLHIL